MNQSGTIPPGSAINRRHVAERSATQRRTFVTSRAGARDRGSDRDRIFISPCSSSVARTSARETPNAHAPGFARLLLKKEKG